MANPVSIANRALTKLGSQPILNMDETSEGARAMKRIYNDTLRAELRAYRWKFAIKRVKVPALADPPIFGYQHAYMLPSDYLALVQINECIVTSKTQLKPLWSIESGKILTDFAAPLKIRYVWELTDPNQFDALFVEAFACKLALEACELLTQSNTKKQAAYQEYKEAVQLAVQQSAIEKAPDNLPRGEWLRARDSYGEYCGHWGWGDHV